MDGNVSNAKTEIKTELATMPANIPYVRPDSERLAKWRDRLAANGRLSQHGQQEALAL